jgi:hypothetical protein
MSDSQTFEEIFDEHTHTDRVEKSLKEYSNWLLGISLGLGAAIVSTPNNFKDCIFFYIVPLTFVFTGILFNGHLKYLILNREIQLNTHFGHLKKVRILREASKTKEIPIEDDVIRMEQWNSIFQKYTAESNKLESIGNKLNWATYFTALNVVLTGIFILLNTVYAS